MSVLPGHAITDGQLCALGFGPHTLDVERVGIVLPTGMGCEWRTLGDVPESPGVYAFTVEDAEHQSVAYVGSTSHLWMVTKGRLPHSGGSRPGNRYGRPLYAADGRVRINILIAAEIKQGRRVRHWAQPLQASLLRAEEETLILRWRLREHGWNLR